MSHMDEIPQATMLRLANRTYMSQAELEVDKAFINRAVWYIWVNYLRRYAEELIPKVLRWYIMPRLDKIIERGFGPRPDSD